MMNRVREIVRLHREADGFDDNANVRRWGEARLIHEELTTGGRSLRALSAAIKEAGGESGSSLRHLQLMRRCWETAGLPLWDGGNEDFSKYPRLNELYNSDEIRNPGGDHGDGESGERGDRKRGGDERERDYSAHGIIIRVTSGIDALDRRPDIRATIADEDVALLREAYRQLTVFLRQFGRSSRLLRV